MVRYLIIIMLMGLCSCMAIADGYKHDRNIYETGHAKENLIGLTKNEIIERFGEPRGEDKSVSFSKYGNSEIWEYRASDPNPLFWLTTEVQSFTLHFED